MTLKCKMIFKIKQNLKDKTTFNITPYSLATLLFPYIRCHEYGVEQ